MFSGATLKYLPCNNSSSSVQNPTAIPTSIDNYNAVAPWFLRLDMRLYHEAVHARFEFPLRSAVLFPQALMMATDKPLLLSAIL